jgi:hypothetical protein
LEWSKKVVKWFFILVVLWYVDRFLGLAELPFHLVFGWLPYLCRVIPQTQINVELLLCSAGALALGIIGLQALMSRLLSGRRWRWRYTLVWCAALIVMFCTSIAAVGIVHQTGWLFRLPRWIDWTGMSSQIKTMINAKQVLLAALNYASAHDGKLPDTCAEMMPEIVPDARIFWGSMDINMPLEPLVYAGAGLRETDAADLPVVWSAQIGFNGRRAVARIDGSAAIVREEEFQVMLARLLEHLAKQQGAARQH